MRSLFLGLGGERHSRRCRRPGNGLVMATYGGGFCKTTAAANQAGEATEEELVSLIGW